MTAIPRHLKIGLVLIAVAGIVSFGYFENVVGRIRSMVQEPEKEAANPFIATTEPLFSSADPAIPVRVFFPPLSGLTILASEQRTIFKSPELTNRAKQLLKLIVDGPLSRELLPSMPKDTKLQEVFVSHDGVLFVDFSSAISAKLRRRLIQGKFESGADIAALADADARENWSFMMNFRDRLMAAPSLEAVYVALARKGAGDLPPIFLSQLCHLILRNALEGCEDPYTLRAAELFYRSQLAAVHDGTLLLADAEVIEAEQHAQHDLHSSPLTAMLQQPKTFGEMDVMDDENAWTYWSRSDAHAMAMNLGGNAKARAGLCRVIERWIGHLLGVTVSVETVPSIEDRDWRWFVGLDSDATRIGNALWRGERLDSSVAERIVALMRLTFEDARLVDARVGDKPVYLILAMGADKVVRLKPQNLIAGLPLAAAANVA